MRTTWKLKPPENQKNRGGGGETEDIIEEIRDKGLVQDRQRKEIYYNIDGKLVNINELDRTKNIFKKKERYDEDQAGPGKVIIKLNKEYNNANRGKNLIIIWKTLIKLNIKPNKMNMISFSTAEAEYERAQEANMCLDKLEREKETNITAHLDAVSLTSKGVISDWPDNIKELWAAITEPQSILKMEKIYRRKWNKQKGELEEIETGNITITFKGNGTKKAIRLWDNTVSIKLRPYVEQVKQCYKCFRYGHVKAMCKSEERCIICGEKAHGRCDKREKCRNFQENHRSTYKGCAMFEKNKNIQIIKAYNNVNYNKAIRILEGKEAEEERYNRYEEPEQWPKIVSTKEKSGNTNNYPGKSTLDYARAVAQKNTEPEQQQQQRKSYTQRDINERKRETVKNNYITSRNIQEEAGVSGYRQRKRTPVDRQRDEEEEYEEETEEIEELEKVKKTESIIRKEELTQLIIKLKRLINRDSSIKREVFLLLEDTEITNTDNNNTGNKNEGMGYQKEQLWNQGYMGNRKRYRENKIVNEIQRKYWRANQSGN